MEKVEIFFRKEVEDFFNALVLELFEKDYFSSLEYAIEYKEKLISFIKNSINLFPAKRTPKKLKSLEISMFSTKQIKIRLGIFSLKDLITNF